MKKFNIRMLSNYRSGLFLNDIRRVVLLGVALGLAGLPLTGFSSPQDAENWGDSSVPDPIKGGTVAPARPTPQDAENWGDSSVPDPIKGGAAVPAQPTPQDAENWGDKF